MADEQKPASQETPGLETQPQGGPAAPPEGTPAPATQPQGTPETPEVLAARKAYWQTKAQELQESAKKAQSELAAYRAQYGPLSTQPQVPSPTTVTPLPQYQQTATETAPLDPYDPAYPQYLKSIVEKTIVETTEAMRRQEQFEAQRNYAAVQLEKWNREHNIPVELQNRAAQEYVRRFGLPGGAVAGTPDAIMEWIQDYIIKEISSGNQQSEAAHYAEEAARKAKALASVQQPAPGQAPPPSSVQEQQKQATEAQANYIAPDSIYGGSG